jgi:hypothetical protein
MSQPEEMPDLVQRHAFDEVIWIVHISDVREPRLLDTIEHDVTLGNRAAGERGKESDAQSTSDAGVAVVDRRACLGPIQNVRSIRRADVHGRIQDASLFKLEMRVRDGEPLTE